MKRIQTLVAVTVLLGSLVSLSGCILLTGPFSLIGCSIFQCNLGQALLSADSSGRQDALNPLPINADVAVKLGASVNDIGQYNDELPQVITVNSAIEADIALAQREKLSGEQLDPLVAKYGFTNFKEFETIANGDDISEPALIRFSLAQGLTLPTARLFIKLRFGVK